eukprot:7144035-Alexandrium_andersonii.AAC.1
MGRNPRKTRGRMKAQEQLGQLLPRSGAVRRVGRARRATGPRSHRAAREQAPVTTKPRAPRSTGHPPLR